MSIYRLIVFDLDGTLVDTAPDISLCANRILAEEGLKPKTLEEIQKAIGLGVRELFRRLLSEVSNEASKIEELAERFRKLYSENLVGFSRPYDGVLETLKGPLRNVFKAVVTNKPHAMTCEILEKLELLERFHKVIGAQAGFPYKPDAAAVLSLLECFGVSGSETILIGDSSTDLQTAQNAGIDFAWVRWGYEDLSHEGSLRSFGHPSEWRTLVNGAL